MTRAVGADHPWTLGCALNAAGARNFAGDPESAAELSRATGDTGRRARLGGHHPLTLSCRIALATDLRNLRQRQEADKIEEEALAALAGDPRPAASAHRRGPLPHPPVLGLRALQHLTAPRGPGTGRRRETPERRNGRGATRTRTAGRAGGRWPDTTWVRGHRRSPCDAGLRSRRPR